MTKSSLMLVMNIMQGIRDDFVFVKVPSFIFRILKYLLAHASLFYIRRNGR